MKIIITGAGGRLGRSCASVFKDSVPLYKSLLDVVERESCINTIRGLAPDVIIHCAAITSVRQCEMDKNLAWHTNVLGTKNLIDACNMLEKRCKVVYVSTACVFYGDRGYYSEDDAPNPKNYYAMTKLMAESIVSTQSKHDWMIVRTNFVAKEPWPYSKAFVDRYGTYLFADQVALGIKEALELGRSGIVHICGDKKMSMFELAKITTPNIQPTTMSEYQGPPLTIDMSLVSNTMRAFTIDA